jgi:hypothetical protein
VKRKAKSRRRRIAPSGRDVIDRILGDAAAASKRRRFRPGKSLAAPKAPTKQENPVAPEKAPEPSSLTNQFPDLRKTQIRLKDGEGRLWPMAVFLDYELVAEGDMIRFVGRLRPDGVKIIRCVVRRAKLEEALK